jgi:thioesterase domain-containing protein
MIVGGGMPMGVVAGYEKVMDGIDGGAWSFGDDSCPSKPTTVFGGTFNKHPMTLAASYAVLKELKKDRHLLDRLSKMTKEFVDRMNGWLLSGWYPCRLIHCASLWKFIYTPDMTQMVSMFQKMMNLEGVYMWEGHRYFFSAAHTAEDVAFIESKIKCVLEEMRLNGLISASLPPFDLLPPDAPSYSPAVILKRTGNCIPYFLVHPGIRSVLGYMTFAQLWKSKQQPLIAFGDESGMERDGSLDPENEPKSVEELASRYVHSMRSIQPIGPYIIGGWSFGGIIGLHMAQILEDEGERCLALHMFDQNAPQHSIFDEASAAELYHGELSKAQGSAIGDQGYLHLSTANRLETAYRMHHKLKTTCITLFRVNDLMKGQPITGSGGDDDYGLHECTMMHPVRVVRVPGNHVSMFTKPHVEHLTKAVKDDIYSHITF